MRQAEALVVGQSGPGYAVYLFETRSLVNKIVAIAHNAKAFDLHFILNRAILLKCHPEMIMNGLKIMCMRMQHLVFMDSVP